MPLCDHTSSLASTLPYAAPTSNTPYILAPAHIKPMLDVHEGIGPAAALLAAHTTYPSSTFLLLVCNFPLAEPHAFEKLINANFGSLHPTLATASLHPEDMHTKLLFAVWGPMALQALKRNMDTRAKTEPGFTLREVLGREEDA